MTQDRQDFGDRRHFSSDIPAELERRSSAVRELELKLERKSPNHIVLHMVNEFVAQNRYLFDEVLERLSPQQPGMRIEIDVSQVPYADSEALGRFLHWAKRLAQVSGSFVVVNPTPYVTSIIQMLQMDASLLIVHRHNFPTNGE